MESSQLVRCDWRDDNRTAVKVVGLGVDTEWGCGGAALRRATSATKQAGAQVADGDGGRVCRAHLPTSPAAMHQSRQQSALSQTRPSDIIWHSEHHALVQANKLKERKPLFVKYPWPPRCRRFNDPDRSAILISHSISAMLLGKRGHLGSNGRT